MAYHWIVYVVAAVFGFFWGAWNFKAGVWLGLIAGVAMLLVFVMIDYTAQVSPNGVALPPILVEKCGDV